MEAMFRALLAIALFAPWLVRAAEPTQDEIVAWTNAPLKGLRTVGVIIEAMDPDAAKFGLTENELQTSVELAARRMGLKVLPVKTALSFLYLRVQCFLEEGLVVYSVALHLEDRATNNRTKQTRHVVVWNANVFGTVGQNKARDSLLQNTNRQMERFENAWRSVN